MVKMKHLAWANWLVSLAMAFTMGFLAGTNYPEASLIYWVVLMGACAFAKVEIYHWRRKPESRERAQTTCPA